MIKLSKTTVAIRILYIFRQKNRKIPSCVALDREDKGASLPMNFWHTVTPSTGVEKCRNLLLDKYDLTDLCRCRKVSKFCA